jgi:hypothetical protein
MQVQFPRSPRLRLGAAALLCASALAPGMAQAASVCVTAPYVESGYVSSGCVVDGTLHAEGAVERNGDWAVSTSVGGEYRGGTWSNTQSADLASGVMRSTLLYASGPADRGEYLLNNYIDLDDGITFSGSGSAVFNMRLTGAFLGAASGLWGNSMDTSLDLYSETRGDDVLGRIHLAHRLEGEASFTAGSSCGWTFGIGRVECVVHSLSADDIDISMSVHVDDITDGERFWFGSRLNLQAYGPREGGVAFGNTARLSVTLSDGLGFASDSGALLTAVPHAAVPLPSGALLAGLGLCAVALTRPRRP